MSNIYSALPSGMEHESFDELLRSGSVRIERIVSRGQISDDWYDQTENEWVMVLEGAASLLFDDGNQVSLGKGDYLNIPAHVRHRVTWTDPDRLTVWLAIFYS